MKKVKHALILAGGSGERLSKIVGDNPKPMVDIAGKPILYYLVQDLVKSGLDQITFLTGNHSSVIESYFGNGDNFGIKVDYSIENEPSGIAGAIHNALKHIRKDEWYLVVHGDRYYDGSITQFLNHDPDQSSEIVSAVFKVPGRSADAALNADENIGQLPPIQKKSSHHSSYKEGGIYLVKGSLIHQWPSEKPLSLGKDVLKKHPDRLELFPLVGTFYNIDDPKSYADLYMHIYLSDKNVSPLEKRLSNQIARGGKIWVIQEESTRDKKESLFEYRSIDTLLEQKNRLKSEDMILHDFPLHSKMSGRIRRLNTVVAHTDADAVRFGVADHHIEDLEQLKKIEIGTKRFCSDAGHLFKYFQKHKGIIPALFLDRDGVLIEHVDYPKDPDQVTLIEEIIPLLKYYREKGWYLIVITNQSGIGRGYYDELDYKSINRAMEKKLMDYGVTIDSIYYSPYYERSSMIPYYQGAQYRKPAPGLFLEASKQFDIDLKSSVMIGNRSTDLLAAFWAQIENLILFNSLSGQDIEELHAAEKKLGLTYKTVTKETIPERLKF